MIKLAPVPREVARQSAYLVWALAKALHEAWAWYLFDDNGVLRGLEDLADIWTSKGEEVVYASTLAAYERERPEDLRPALLTRTLGGEWTRSFPLSQVLIRVTQRGFLYLERGGLHVWGTLGGEVRLEDRERYWGHYAILKDLLLSAITHLEDKEEAAEAKALLSNALTLLSNALAVLEKESALSSAALSHSAPLGGEE
ncbi:hypothetical protein MN1_720 [Thermus phage MN1]|nr:hypothetical protein MN1_720 [Thermus phage MN1]